MRELAQGPCGGALPESGDNFGSTFGAGFNPGSGLGYLHMIGGSGGEWTNPLDPEFFACPDPSDLAAAIINSLVRPT